MNELKDSVKKIHIDFEKLIESISTRPSLNNQICWQPISSKLIETNDNSFINHSGYAKEIENISQQQVLEAEKLKKLEEDLSELKNTVKSIQKYLFDSSKSDSNKNNNVIETIFFAIFRK